MQFNYLILLFLVGLLLPNDLTAQKKGNNTKKTTTTSKTKVKPAPKENKQTVIISQLDKMSRDEKNTLSKCPLHRKQMSISDNFEADVSSNPPVVNYPFAYQLNYRRYCDACTRIQKRAVRLDKKQGNTESFSDSDHCAVHKTTLANNPDYNKNDHAHKTIAEMPHAKQYRLKKYCKVCTKIYKIQR